MACYIIAGLTFTILSIGSQARAEPLHEAVKKGNTAQVQKLTAQGANVNTKDEDGYTALILAAASGHTAIAELLVSKGADLNLKGEDGVTPLIVAAQEGHVPVVKLLLGNGVDVNAKDNKGFAALYIAAQNGQRVIVEMLLDRGANINAKNDGGLTPLHIAAYKGNLAIAELLLSKGADVNATSNIGTTVFTAAAEGKHVQMIELLERYKTAQSKVSKAALEQFCKQVALDVDKWEKEAPENIKAEINLLRKRVPVASVETADRLAAMGTKAQGATKALIETVDDQRELRPGNFSRLMGAKSSVVGERAVDALVAISNSTVPTLICRLSRGGDDSALDITRQGLKKITSEDFGIAPDRWLIWWVEKNNITLQNPPKPENVPLPKDVSASNNEDRYYNKELMFSLILPKNWEREGIVVGGKPAFAASDPKSSVSISVIVKEIPAGTKVQIEEFLGVSLAYARKQTRKFQEYDKGKLVIDNRHALWAVYSAIVLGENEEKNIVYTVLGNRRLYVLTCGGLPEDFSKNRPLFDEIARSLWIER